MKMGNEQFINLCEELIAKEKEIAVKIFAIDTGVSGLKTMADGIINVEKYLSAKYKILWILKEAYVPWGPGKDGGQTMGGWLLCNDFYNRCSRKDFVKSALGRRELMVSHAILSDIPDEAEAFKSTAVIEIKKIPNGMTKSGGGKYADWNELQKAYNVHKDILLEQIATYNPDVVICGNTLQFFEKDLNYKEGIMVPLDLGKHNYYCLKDRVYINADHPAYLRKGINDKKYVSAIYDAFIDWRNNYNAKEN
jgi:hypothetical protein